MLLMDESIHTRVMTRISNGARPASEAGGCSHVPTPWR